MQPGSFDLSHALTHNGLSFHGIPTLSLAQVHGHFVGEVNVLGLYTLQLVDASGQPLSGVQLRTPISYLYHYQPDELPSMNLDPGSLILTYPVLIAAARQAHQPTNAFTIPLHNDPRLHTLSGQSHVLGPFDLSGNPDNQSPPSPQVASVQGNSGQLSYSYPFTLAPGPSGVVPSLALTYSSSNSNEHHSLTAPSSSVGEGWTLSMGSITAQEYPTGSAGEGTWYFISGVANVSDRLIPNPHPGNPNEPDYLTEHISQLRIRLEPTGGPGGQPCWHVWDTSGTYYSFGCSSDSLQYNTDSNGTRHNYRWDLNSVAINPVPHGQNKSITIKYLQDITHPYNPGYTAIRDAVMEQIVYGGASTAGTVDFYYRAPFTSSPWSTAYGNNYNCKSAPLQTTTLRCDDPLDHPQGPGQNAPTVMSTFSLQSLTSYVGDDSSASHADSTYVFTYEDDPFLQCWDDYTQVQRYCTGLHQLTNVTPTVYQNGVGHPLKGLNLSYTGALTDDYIDTTHHIIGGDTSQYLHNTTYWPYLSSYMNLDTGVGATISYMAAYNNTHGTPNYPNDQNITDDRYDPLYCSKHSGCSGNYNYPQDQAWSTQVVTSITTSGRDSSGVSAATTQYAYRLIKEKNNPAPCPAAGTDTDCVTDMWLPHSASNKTDSDFLDYYHEEYRGFNWVYITSPAGDLTADNYASTDGVNTLEGNVGNYTAGSLYEEDVYRGNSTSGPLLRKTVTQYAGQYFATSCNGGYSDLYTPCEVVPLNTISTTYEGTNSSSAPWVRQDYTFDDYNNGPGAGYHNLTKEVITSSTAPTLTRKWGYTTNDQSVGGWTYYNVHTATHSELDDASGHVWQCQDRSYDEGLPSGTPTPVTGLLTTVKSYSNCANQANTTLTSYAGYDGYGDQVATVDAVGTANAGLYGSSGTPNYNGCTLSSNPALLSPNWSKTNYTTCTAYDTNKTFLPISLTNALSQASSMNYDATQGAVLASTLDLNGQGSYLTYSYDQSGNRSVQVSQPGDLPPQYTTQSSSFSSCTGSSPPCFELDSTTSLYNTAISRTFYDSLGRATETRTPGPGPSLDTIVFTVYNDSAHSSFQSVPFEVTSGSSWVDPTTAKDKNGTTPSGTATFLDALGRIIALRDPIYNPPSVPGIPCSATLSGTYTACTNYGLGSANGDSATYASTTSIDPNNHVAASFADALGRTRYVQEYSGLSGGTLTINQQKRVQSNALNLPTSISVTDLASQPNQGITTITTTASYDDLGRLTQLVDPDRGTHTFTYDGDGHLLTDVSGSRTLGTNDDLLGRVGSIQDAAPQINATGACTTGSDPLIQITYDVTKIGTQGQSDFPIGRLTKTDTTTYFPEGGTATTTQKMQYDKRGEVTQQQQLLKLPNGWNVSFALPTEQAVYSYNDANQLTSMVTNTLNPNGPGATTTPQYDSTTGVLTGVSNRSGLIASQSFTVNGLLDTLSFQTSTGTALATEQFTYDGDLRPVSATATWQSGSGSTGQIFQQNRWYDPASNVISLSTTQAAVPGQSHSGGSETANFCYDEQNRLTWSGNASAPPSAGNGTCGSQSFSSSLQGASYTNTFRYTHLGQLWQAPLNGSNSASQYLYCTAGTHQLDGLYSTGSTCANKNSPVYQSSYDAWGNVSSRTTGGSTATLSYDQLDRLIEDTNSSAGTQEWYLYDASGNRVLRRSTSGGTTTITTYAFGSEEHLYSGSGNNLSNTYYYSLSGRLVAAFSGNVSTGSIYLTDALGSVLSTFSNTSGSAAVLGNQVYGPYGTQRYQKGAMGTTKGFTGQYNDGVTGLDYYNSRYYDPLVGVFVSVDKTQGDLQGVNPYGNVGGNPESRNDPTGQFYAPPPPGGRGGSGNNNNTTTSWWSNVGNSSYSRLQWRHRYIQRWRHN